MEDAEEDAERVEDMAVTEAEDADEVANESHLKGMPGLSEMGGHWQKPEAGSADTFRDPSAIGTRGAVPSASFIPEEFGGNQFFLQGAGRMVGEKISQVSHGKRRKYASSDGPSDFFILLQFRGPLTSCYRLKAGKLVPGSKILPDGPVGGPGSRTTRRGQSFKGRFDQRELPTATAEAGKYASNVLCR